MTTFLTQLFSEHYIPHGHCYLWQSGLVWFHALSDLITALAYYLISVILVYFVRKREDIAFPGIFLLFSFFILFCGTTHLLAVWTLWHPIYWVSGFVKAATALVSLYTALELLPLMPLALALPSPKQLEAINHHLVHQITERKQAEETLRQSEARLQRSLEFEALLKRITDRVRDSLDEQQILQSGVAELAQGLNVLAAHANLYNAEQTTATIAYQSGHHLITTNDRTVEIATTPHVEIYSSLLKGKNCQFCDLPPNPQCSKEQLFSNLVVPILDNQDVLGNLWLFKEVHQGFDEQEVLLIQQVANQCAIGLRQSHLYQSAQIQVQELERLNRLKDDFLNTVSHELRTPMSNIKMAIQMLDISLSRMGLLSDEPTPIKRYFKVLQEEGQREITLINDLLDLARLNAETESLEQTEIHLQDYLPHIAETFVQRIQQQKQHLLIYLPEELPPVSTHLPYLERIFSELLNNACKYTPKGETIALSAQASSASLDIQVKNSGIEIPPNEYNRIFDKFYRIPSHDPWKHGGTGLGLALVKKLVQQLQGDISVTSQDNWTNFTVSLKLN